MHISKSDYQIGRRCLKRLWHEKHRQWIAKRSANDEKNAFEGNRFNDAVHEHFSDGIMIGWEHGSIEEAVEQTTEYLKRENVTLFEAFFLHNGLLCLADVIVKQGTKITLIEAKSSNNPKIAKKDDFEHIHDAAFQAYVMTQCGYKPDEIQLLHANGDCIWPDKSSLFTVVDIAEQAFAMFDEIEMAANLMLLDIGKPNSPEQAIGKFCKKPADKACPHIELCWQRPAQQTIYDLPRLSDAKINQLETENVHLITDVPASAELSNTQRDIVHLIQNEVESVDAAGVSDLLGQLEYPLHFFDFETYNAAVPMWDQSRPWQQIPFQYSLHILQKDGQVEHYEYLHTGADDPRLALIDAMKNHFLDHGSVVVYYAPFEKSRMKEMAEDFPENADFLMPLVDRTWDQLDVFKRCFNDHRLALSKSIKVVLPTFVPELSYTELNVQKGDQAQLEWRNMIDLESEQAKQNLADDLKAYCKLDTLAMLKLHEFLESLSS